MSAPPIAVIGPFPPPVHGAAAVTEALADLLAAGRETPRMSLSPGRARGPARHLARGARTLAALARLAAFRARGGRDAWLACDGGMGQAWGLAVVAAARALGIEIRLHHHSFAYIDRPSRLMTLTLRAGGGRLRHVFLSPGMQARFAARHGPVRGDVLSNALFVPVAAAAAEAAAPARDPAAPLTLGLLGNLTAAKGVREFLALLAALEARGTPARGVLAGPAEGAERAAIEAALGPRLDWLGPVRGEAKAAFFAAIDLFVLPTRHPDEAQPVVIFEAAAAGVPTLAWGRGAIPEQVGEPDMARDPAEPFLPWAADRAAALAADRPGLAARGAAARARLAAEAKAARAALEALAGRGGAADGPTDGTMGRAGR